MVAKSAFSRTRHIAVPALFESDPPVGPYMYRHRRLLNSVLVVVRLCIVPVAVVISPSQRLVSLPCRLVTSSPCRLALPPRRLVASSLPCLIATSRIRRSLARISGIEPGSGRHTTNANHLVFRAGSTAMPAAKPPPRGVCRCDEHGGIGRGSSGHHPPPRPPSANCTS